MVVNIINHFNLDFVLPISMCDENMERAHKRSGILNEKFWFNKNFIQSEKYWESNLQKSNWSESKTSPEERIKPEYEEFYLHEIMCGKEGTDFQGLCPVMGKFMEVKEYDQEDKDHINYFFTFLKARAMGKVPTGAKFIRDFIHQCPCYDHDSKLCLCTMTLLV
jgi:glutamate--cysteine ligase catalytic subunit